MCSRCDIFVLTLIAHISLYLTDTLSVLREYLNILRIPPEFSAVQCISFFRFGRVSYYAFHTYHTNIGNILLSIEDILYMLPRIAKISHIGGKVVPELGETRCEVVQCGNGPQAGFATCPSAGRQLRLRRARFYSHGYQVDGHLRPRVEGAG